MTDQEKQIVLRDLRTARAHYKGESYTVSLDHFAVETHDNNVWWINKPDDGFMPTTMHASGVLLTQYQVTKDDDPTWHAVVELGAPDTPDGRLRIVAVSITAHDLETTALPIVQIREACVRVGGVIGHFRDVVGELSGLTIRTYRISAPMRNEEGELFHPDELHKLTGEQPPKKRGYRNADETLQAVWASVCEYRNERDIRRAQRLGRMPITQAKWVSQQCGLPFSNVNKQITAANKKYGTTNGGKK